MATKSAAKKDTGDDVILKVGQSRPTQGRYRLQVDRQTKSTYESLEEAEKVGQAIKKAHPIVQVSVYDAVESAQTILE
ncbi:MAG TPA: hypothetical protein VHT93_15860 [Pseudolabrys sp.]|jgi:hypothetical protein|nr:hypothetical protein [Pseudolabrys sp.]